MDDALGLIVVEVDVVLQRAGVVCSYDLHAVRGQALELLELALVKLESSDTLQLTHRSGLHCLLRSKSPTPTVTIAQPHATRTS
jgi:hypothetical protein